MRIVIATENPHKLSELQHILPSVLSNSAVQYSGLKDFLLTLPPETGETLAANAILKAQYVAKETGLLAVSDDTGLEVDFLNGAPGVYTARYAGEHGHAQANNRKLLEELKDVPWAQRTARFKTAACLAFPDGKYQLFEGIVEGYITTDYRGQNGFGYDPIFFVTQKGKTFAELSEPEKNAVSHRGRAFKQLIAYLETFFK